MAAEASGGQRKRLDSWKEIAGYIGRDVRTAMRWEDELGLPVRCLPGGTRRAVFALTDEIDEWLQRKGAAVTAAAAAEDADPKTLSSRRSRIFAGASFMIALLFTIGWRFWLPSRPWEIAFELPNRRFQFIARTITLKGSMGQIHAADLNSDGYPDLVIGGAHTGQMAVLLNRRGRFDPPKYLPTCIGSQGPVTGDFDGDGAVDISVNCADSNEVEIQWGNGRGEFEGAQRWKVGGIPLTSAVGDWNRDGLADLAVGATGGGPLVVLFGDRKRELLRSALVASGPNSLSAVDLDGDGILDLLSGTVLPAATEVTLFKGHGNGNFDEPRAIPAGSHPWRTIAGDFTGDGIADLISSSVDGTVMLVQGVGGGLFANPAIALRRSSSLVVFPFPTPEKNYVISLQSYPWTACVLEFRSDGIGTHSNDVAFPKSPTFAVTADLNRDGLTDIVVMGYDKEFPDLYVLLQMK